MDWNNLISSPLIILLLFIAGSIIGSFLNVCIYRLPRGKSIVTPRSQCPHCHTMIRAWNNIPLVSFFILKGKCHSCQGKISWRYPLVEWMGALLAVITYLSWGLTPLSLFYYVVLCSLVVITIVDLDFMIIPDEISLPGILYGLLGSFLIGHITLLESFLGGLLGGGGLLLIASLYTWIRRREGLGGGDIKFAAMIGTITGPFGVIYVLAASSLLGALVGVSLMLIYKKNLQWAIPYGPFLAAGTALYLFFGRLLLPF